MTWTKKDEEQKLLSIMAGLEEGSYLADLLNERLFNWFISQMDFDFSTDLMQVNLESFEIYRHDLLELREEVQRLTVEKRRIELDYNLLNQNLSLFFDSLSALTKQYRSLRND